MELLAHIRNTVNKALAARHLQSKAGPAGLRNKVRPRSSPPAATSALTMAPTPMDKRQPCVGQHGHKQQIQTLRDNQNRHANQAGVLIFWLAK
jgi:hypothetical protein